MAKILVVEDDAAMSEALIEVLEDEGYEAVAALSGEDAIRLAADSKFDLVVSDVRLPGMNGIETLTSLKKQDSQLKCIVITGYASADVPVQAIRLKVDDYLFKPFGLQYFHRAVERALATEQGREENFTLFQRLFAHFSLAKDTALEDLVAERQEAYRGLYLGTRSGYLVESAAHEVFDTLDGLEEQFRSLLNNPKLESGPARELQASYTSVSNRLAQLEGQSVESHTPDRVPAEQFRNLYEALRGSQISPDDLMYAPLLRTTPDERFETLPKLLELKNRLWPDCVV